MVVIYFKSDSRIRVIVLVEDDPSVINAINDGLITGLLNGTGSYPFHAKECWHFALLIPERFFSSVVYRRGVTAPHSISSTGAFLLRRPYSVPFSILRKRLKPKVHPKFSRSHEYSTVFASIRGVIRMNIPLEQNACMQEFHMCNVCRQTLIIYDLLTIAKRNRSILI